MCPCQRQIVSHGGNEVLRLILGAERTFDAVDRTDLVGWFGQCARGDGIAGAEGSDVVDRLAEGVAQREG